MEIPPPNSHQKSDSLESTDDRVVKDDSKIQKCRMRFGAICAKSCARKTEVKKDIPIVAQKYPRTAKIFSKETGVVL